MNWQSCRKNCSVNKISVASVTQHLTFSLKVYFKTDFLKCTCSVSELKLLTHNKLKAETLILPLNSYLLLEVNPFSNSQDEFDPSLNQYFCFRYKEVVVCLQPLSRQWPWGSARPLGSGFSHSHVPLWGAHGAHGAEGLVEVGLWKQQLVQHQNKVNCSICYTIRAEKEN